MQMPPSLSPGQATTLRLDTVRREAERLTSAQAKRLAGLSADWKQEPDEWKAGVTFLRMEQRGLCQMESRRIKGGSITAGPGNTSVYRWFTRRTEFGEAVFVHRYNAQTIRRTENATR